MTIENMGRYELNDHYLKLSFKNETTKQVKKYYKTLSNNIGTEYKILNDTLFCIDCEHVIILEKTEPNN